MSPRVIPSIVLTAFLAGCTTAQTSNTARTATEQLLLSNAVDQSLDKVDFKPLHGQNVFLEEKYIDSVDKQYIIASIRHRILRAGGHLAEKIENADIVLEPRSGGVGTTTSSSFVGIPSFSLPGMVTIPEVKLFTRSQQAGYAKLGLAAYDPKTRESRGQGGMSVAQSNDNNYYFAGVGPWQTGTLREEITRTTTGTAAIRRDQLPPNVAFTPGPKRLQEESGTALVNGEVEQVRAEAPDAPK
ncbi:hypothetical protein Pan44_24290 [Caulifigura coniformis]|uniref:Uncharacterized protein n=1 Tax=Caulifigura coniformis TaxID=2527983 RepID=A0A517SE41_9PLAN|nr:DUF6655 family protein [Caulifigura coniformis]QDT54396.1 hypothetical protein Pan44_24290 [Caulifigura coniformis]